MRFLFDLSHPAHVHFSRHLLGELGRAGHETRVVARDKEVTTDLLDGFGIPYTAVGRSRSRGRVGQAAELVRRDWALWRAARQFRPDVIVTRNPAGVQAARLARVRGVFDTDDGRAVGVHFRAAAPFAHAITTPDCITESFGRKHVKYPSYKALAFLHPDRFTPDPSILGALGVSPGESYFLVRFVALDASHDRGARGMSLALKREVLGQLSSRGRVFVSSEQPLPDEFAHYDLPTRPERMHDVLAFAQLCVTDGGSVAAEAAVLGVPAVRYAGPTQRREYLTEMGARYGLLAEFGPGEDVAFLDRVGEWADETDHRRRHEARTRLLADKCDLTTWMAEFLTARTSRGRRAAPR